MIIGFIGFKQVGKSTAAKYLAEEYGFHRVNMKDALVAEIKENFPDLLEEIMRTTNTSTVEKLMVEKPPLMRALLQNYGTEVRRKDSENYWTDQWKKTLSETPGHVVADDVRFINEAEAIREAGGILIRLQRPDIDTGGSHASEVEQLSIGEDYVISCEQGDFKKLKDSLDMIISNENEKQEGTGLQRLSTGPNWQNTGLPT